jgi:alanyl-tRNA synthetase
MEKRLSTELAYLDDPFQLEFDAEILARVTLPDGRRGVILPRTFFFPTGGGQEHDTGTLGAARVTDVVMNDEGVVIHVVDREVTESRVHATIDRARRFAFMQHHSAQHLLSQAILETLGIESVSANINIDHPSTIDLVCGDIDLTPGETRANAIVYEDRPIKTYWITEAQVAQVPFRMPPKVPGKIRVVEIEGFDYSACGGTHCTRTGQIGIVKIVKTERRAEKLRVHFLAGQRAFEYLQRVHAIVTHLARQFDTSPEALSEAVEHQREALRAAHKQVEELRAERLQWEARQLVANARVRDSLKIVVASFHGRAPNELRALAQFLHDEPRVVALLTSYDGAKVSLVVTCASDTHVRADALLRRALTEIGGRGGGDAKIAQGGGTLNEEQWTVWLAHCDTWIQTALE